MARKLPIAILLLLLLACSAAVVWSALNLPPPLWLVKYGLAPGCEPTGGVIPAEGVEFVVIGPGCFRMGSSANGKPGTLPGRFGHPVGIGWGEAPEPSDEMPVHWVEFAHGFGIARTEVTNAQYERFEPEHERSRYSNGDSDPVVNVNREDARRYCEWLSARTGRKVRLPSESEWEAACRGGTSSEYVSGDDGAGLGEYSWYDANSEHKAFPVATNSANAWGLHDLTGNVWEWCDDRWHGSYAETRMPAGGRGAATVERAPTDGSAWSTGGSRSGIIRGGSWANPAVNGRSAGRIRCDLSTRYSRFGFRPALETGEGD